MSTRRISDSTEVEIDVEGKKYRGYYRVEDGVLTVSTVAGRKSTQLGRLPEQLLAELLLRELVDEGKA